jgi:serine/threonine-protein kinase
VFELLEEVRRQQFESWLAGERASVESYLDRYPSLRDQPESAVDLIYSEILLREQLGEAVAWDEYISRFPAYAAALQRQSKLHALFGRDLVSSAQPLTVYPRPSEIGVPSDERRTKPLWPSNLASGTAPWPSIPGFEIEARLGGGGCGVVYRAQQLRLGRTVALKVLRSLAAPEPEEVELFRREATAVAKLKHSQVVQIHWFDVHEGRPYIVMEYVEGGGLDRWPAGKPMAARAAAELLAKLARAVHAVHEEGIIHRDLKPGNVLLGENGIPKIADFGLAKDLGAGVSLFHTGAIVGTPAYMAPEQAGGRSEEIAKATDVYALGAILYEALTGRPPFGSGKALDVLELVKTSMPENPTQLRTDIPRDLENICLKCLQKKTEDRYATAAALADDLDQFLRGEPLPPFKSGRTRRRLPVLRPRHWFIAGALFVIATIGLMFAGYYVTRPTDPETQIHEAIHRAGTYTFVGAKGRPKVIRWPIMEGIFTNPTQDNEGFAFESLRYCPLELLATPGLDRYRFSAKIRHDEKDPTGFVGLVFGVKTYPTASGDVLYSGVLRFSELKIPGDPAKGIVYPNTAGVVIKYCGIAGEDVLSHEYLVPKPLVFEPVSAPVGQGPWRELAVEVRPNNIRAFWEHHLIREIATKELDKHGEFLVNSNKDIGGADPAFHPAGGLGLFVQHGSASFKDVVLEALPPD